MRSHVGRKVHKIHSKRVLHLESLEQRTTMSTLGMSPAVLDGPQNPHGPVVQGAPAPGGPANGPLTIPAYSSLPGATDTIYLDFDGHTEAVWGTYSNVPCPVYDIDGDFTSFSAAELTKIREIWSYVAEDYAPFNINVTTVLPTSFANGSAIRVAFGGDGAWLGSIAGGVAWIDAYSNGLSNTVWVFTDYTGFGSSRGAANTASHEAGHAYGLEHQSTYGANGVLVDEYNSGDSEKAPIMGSGYTSRRVVWSNGTSTSATTFQDDMAVLARPINTFGYRTDDYGDTPAKAKALRATGSSISANGVISKTTDADVFAFASGKGTFSLNVTLPGENNLDSVLELRSSKGALLATSNSTTSDASSLTYTTPADGIFYATVKSAGVYGDVGQYTFSGTVVPTKLQPGVNPPTNVTANADSLTSITVSWDAVSVAAQYRIERQVGTGPWQVIATVNAPTTTFRNKNLVTGTTYSYRITTIDAFGGESEVSAVATTTIAPPSAPTRLIATVIGNGAGVKLSWQDNSSETYFILERQSNPAGGFVGIAKLAANTTTYTDTTVVSGKRYLYRVRAVNGIGTSDYSNQALAIVLSTSNGRSQSQAAQSSSQAQVDRLFGTWQ